MMATTYRSNTLRLKQENRRAVNFVDISGQRFGHLVVLSYAGTRGDRRATWLCQCDCGRQKIVTGKLLRIGSARSCGCAFKQQAVKETKRQHGKSNSAEWRTWAGMRQRCNSPTSKDYPRYGGRGICVCKRWNESFEAFLEDMGLKPTPRYSLDRINNDGDYQPSNCRWAPPKTQARNRRNNRSIRFNGKTQTLAAWAKEVGMGAATIGYRLDHGWSVLDALCIRPRTSVGGISKDSAHHVEDALAAIRTEHETKGEK